jgi:uncharacterized protein (TIGR01777 family)
MRVALAGATGLIGSALVPALRARGDRVVTLVRSSGSATPDAWPWDPERGVLDAAGLAGCDVVIHLGGVSVDARWTPAYKRAIRESRVNSTALLARTLAELRPLPRALIVASAVGIYGDRGDEILDEQSATGAGFLAEVGRDWEAAAAPARDAGLRTVHARFGVALARSGGALAKMLPPFELGAGGRIGRGTQWMSWIAREDLVRAVVYAIDHPVVSGPINVTAPTPVTNAEFAKTLGHALHRPAFASIPAFAVRLAYGELADAALLASQRAVPRALGRAGFEFDYPTLDAALRQVLRGAASRPRE